MVRPALLFLFFIVFECLNLPQIMVDQLIIDKIDVPYGKDSFFDANITVARTSGRTMIADGTYIFRQSLAERVSNEMIISHLNNGMWTRTFIHRFDSFCRNFIMPGGTFYNIKTKFFKDLPDRCPLRSGEQHHLKKVIFSRFREDWDAGLKSVIPPVMPDAEKYRLEIVFYNERNRKIGLLRGEGRFLDKKADVAVCECK